MSLNTFAYERGSQAILIPLGPTSANQQQVGTAAPAGANVVALVPTVARGQQPVYIGVQLRITGTVTGGAVTLLGSMDGVNFFALPGLTPALSGAAVGLATITPPVPVRFLSAAVASFTGGGQVEVSVVI
jgi:hypothetical protein